MQPPATDQIRAIERVPAELLGDIFAHTLPCLCRDASEASPTAPWWIGHICSRWRSAALAHASLWCDVSLYAAHHTPITVASREEMLATLLARSRGAPLRIQLHWSIYVALAREGVSTLVNMVLQHSERWETILVDIDASSAEPILDLLTHRARGRIPRLLALDIRCNHVARHGFWAAHDAFVDAPELTTLSITGPWFTSSSIASSLPLPRAQITTLRISFSHQHTAIDALRAFPNLETLRLSVISGSRRLGQSDVVEFADLRDLELNTESNILKWVTLPSLRSLHLLRGGLQLLAVPDMLRRSRCPLVRLVIHSSCKAHTSEVLAVLALCPALRELKLVLHPGNPMSDQPLTPTEFIRALVVGLDGDGAGVVPALTRLDLIVHVEGGLESGLNRDLVLRMLEAWAARARGTLKYARIAGLEGPVDVPPFAATVLALKEGGMVLDLLAS
ncbi:F-box domain-containing protein [Mycena kentingensis (nom. inval.)]|nr:F-box domain-containing protein [Mycena kentingensis (nom. inval.)]